MTTLVNDTRMKDLMKDVYTMGSDSAAGKDSLPKLSMRVTAAAVEGLLDSKTGAKMVYDEYIKAESKKIIHSDGGKAANTSKLKQFILLGIEFGERANELLARAATMRNELMDEGHKVHAAYPALLQVAREQLKDETRGIMLDDATLEFLLRKPEPKDKDEDAKLALIEKALDRLVSGDKDGTDRHPSPQAQHALDMVTQRRQEIAAVAGSEPAEEPITEEEEEPAITPPPTVASEEELAKEKLANDALYAELTEDEWDTADMPHPDNMQQHAEENGYADEFDEAIPMPSKEDIDAFFKR